MLTEVEPGTSTYGIQGEAHVEAPDRRLWGLAGRPGGLRSITGSGGEAPPAEAATQTAPPAAAPSAASNGWRDLEVVNLCALIHNDEVAALLGVEPTRADLEGATGPACSYQITPDGGSTVQNIFVYLSGADLAEVSLTLARDAAARRSTAWVIRPTWCMRPPKDNTA
jgi:hypothetical protein